MSTSAEVGSTPEPPEAGAPPPTDRPAGRYRRIALVAGVVAVLAAIVFPFAPVHRPVVTYHWPTGPAPTAAAIPMLPYQPTSTTVTITSDAARATRGVLFSTLPPAPEPGTEPLAGLLVTSDGTQITITTGGRTLGPVTVPAGPSRIVLTATVAATTVVLESGGTASTVARADGDVRPAVAGAFTTAARSDGLSFTAVGDTRFQTTASPIKIAVGVVGALALLVLGVALLRLDRLVRARRRRFPERAWRPTLPDVAVTLVLAIWTLIGPITVDDGYIAGIVRARGDDGQVGTVFRWLDSPETPFGWFYDVLHAVSLASPAPLWLRLPSSLLGLVSWFLLGRGLLPRLGVWPRPGVGSRLGVWSRHRWLPWLAAVVFLAWWLPFDLGVRPEPWVVVGTLVVFCLVERALALRVVAPAVLAVGVAAVTLVVTPTGLMAFTVFLVAAVPLARLVAARRDVGAATTIVAAFAFLGVASFLAYDDQSWAAVLDSVHIRTLIGGNLPWTDEYQRWATLLTSGTADGNLGKRAAVLFTVAGLAALATTVTRPRGSVRRIGLVTLFSLATLALTPTKWTHHFGAFAGVGTAVLVVAIDAWWGGRAVGTGTDDRARTGTRGSDVDRRLRRSTAATAVVAVVAGVVLAGWNQWHWLSNVDITWSTLAPQLGGLPFSTVALVLGGVVVVVLGAAIVRRSLQPSWDPPVLRRAHRIPPAVVTVVVVAVVALEVLSFAHTSYSRRNSYTLASDSLAALHGRSCGVADDLLVEPHPRAGLLTPVPGAAGSGNAAQTSGFLPTRDNGPVAEADAGPDTGSDTVAGAGSLTPPRPLVAAGEALPGWRSVAHAPRTPATLTTPWWSVPPQSHLLAVTVAGSTAGTGVRAELGVHTADGVRTVATTELTHATSGAVTDAFSALAPDDRDIRLDPSALAPGADSIRLVATDAGVANAPGLAVATPRVPRTQPWSTLLPPGTSAALDWPVAYLFPCVRIGTLRDGATELPGWRVIGSVSDDRGGGYVSYTASQGGPWTTTRLLVRQERIPVYLKGLALSDVAGLERWVPVAPTGAPAVTRTTVTEPGWTTPGPLTIGRG